MSKNKELNIKVFEERHNKNFPNDKIEVLYKIEKYIYFNTKFGICKKSIGTFGDKSYDSRSALDKTQFFINQANLLYNKKYDYSKTKYLSAKENVIITCPIHGDFQQTANRHLCNQSCDKCGRIRTTNYQKNNPNTWTLTNWIKCANNKKSFDSFKVYIIKCWNEDEEFYKIGRTFLKVHQRFYGKAMPYNYEVLKIIEGTADYIFYLELELKKINKVNKYTPLLNFGGKEECFLTINN